MQLSADQQAALTALTSALEGGQQVVVLCGPAGSGKTTLLRAFLDGLTRDVALVCPTGKAAARLSEVTGRPARTIHRALYASVSRGEQGGELVFGGKKAPCPPGGLVICDEASMVDEILHADLVSHLPPRAQLLYVGDREQLPPVRGRWGPDFETPTAVLETIHRQAEQSPVLALATAIRRGQRWSDWQPEVCERLSGSDPAAWYVERLKSGADVTLVTHTNRRRQGLNAAVRRLEGRTEPLEPGDRVVGLLNNADAGVMNGEVFEVLGGEPSRGASYLHSGTVWNVTMQSTAGGEPVDVLVNIDLIGQPISPFHAWIGRKRRGALEKAVHLDFGACLTVHKSQGSQWAEVGFVSTPSFRRMQDRRRLAYTAVTRAAERLSIFME